jgi:tetratricopeptide (TPR) repeat protein
VNRPPAVPPLASCALAAALAACAGAPPVPAARPAAPPAPAVAVAPAPEASAERGRRLFDEAVHAKEEMEKSKAMDWPVLEARFRAAAVAGDLPEAHYDLGVTLEQQGRLDEARAEYQAALSARPVRQAVVNLGVIAEKTGDSRGAAQAYAEAARDWPEEGLARARLSALYQQSGQLDEAWRLAREALLRDPTSAVAVKTMIRVALAKNDLDLAKLVALRAQKVAPDDAEVAWLAGQVAARQNDEAGATAQWKRALTLQAGFVPARVGLLELSARRERWAEVAEQAGAILRDDPSNAPVELVLGVAHRHLGKPEEALRAYQAAEQLAAGRLPEVFLARGILLMREKGDCPGALGAFDRYEKALGPSMPQGSPAPRLMRECQEQIEQGRAAAEAARAMKAEADAKAAAATQGAGGPATIPTPTVGGGATPTSTPTSPPATTRSP